MFATSCVPYQPSSRYFSSQVFIVLIKLVCQDGAPKFGRLSRRGGHMLVRLVLLQHGNELGRDTATGPLLSDERMRSHASVQAWTWHSCDGNAYAYTPTPEPNPNPNQAWAWRGCDDYTQS